jgi:hypothetical protein
MDLAKKFDDATASASCTSINISSLILNRPYPIVRAKRVTTKFGSTVVLSLRDADEELIQIFLPKRYASVVSDDDISNINSRTKYINLVYKGICEKTRSYLLAIEE